MLRKFDHLQSLANTNLELPGQIRAVQGSALNNVTAMTRVVVLDPYVVVYLSLWDDAAAAFRGHLNSTDVTQSVMVLTTV
uniref:Uncharacterized protein n=1 Tax=Brassica oleracea TaxID=3712 RepID=A0A3P6HCL4_BRAOL|nr:unnamed protein product [Brassica oleracea]